MTYPHGHTCNLCCNDPIQWFYDFMILCQNGRLSSQICDHGIWSKWVIWFSCYWQCPPPFRPSKRRKVDESPGVAFLDLHTGTLACTCTSSCMHITCSKLRCSIHITCSIATLHSLMPTHYLYIYRRSKNILLNNWLLFNFLQVPTKQTSTLWRGF